VKKPWFQTTAIDYPNSRPHIGTAFEKLGADVQARYRRMEGYDVFFLMGNDENTLKVADKAKELGQQPQAYCDDMARVPGVEFIAKQHNEHPKGGWLEFFKALWFKREDNRHKEYLKTELFSSAAEQLRATKSREEEEALHRLLDRFVPREEEK